MLSYSKLVGKPCNLSINLLTSWGCASNYRNFRKIPNYTKIHEIIQFLEHFPETECMKENFSWKNTIFSPFIIRPLLSKIVINYYTRRQQGLKHNSYSKKFRCQHYVIMSWINSWPVLNCPELFSTPRAQNSSAGTKNKCSLGAWGL